MLKRKKSYLPGVIWEGKVGAFTVTEMLAGSDMRAVSTVAERTENGYRLTGRKAHITNAIDAEIFVAFAKLDNGLSAFIVEKRVEGFSIGNKEASMGFRGGYHGELVFDNCFVPKNQILGEEGKALAIVLETLNFSRTGAASVSLGIARAALD